MALLTPPDILPEAMRFLVRGLLTLKEGEADRDELIDLVAPSGLVEAMRPLGTEVALDEADEEVPGKAGQPRAGGNLIANHSLDALRMLGLVEQDSGRIRVADAVACHWSRPADVAPRAFRDFLLDNIFAIEEGESVPKRLDDTADLLRALEILYTTENPLWPCDRFEAAKGSVRGQRSFRETQIAVLGPDQDKWPVRNATRWTAFRRWAAYLGLARQVGSTGIIADASQALAVRLSGLPSGSFDIADFVSRCAEALPLLDGGVLQSRHDRERTGAAEVMSPALSTSMAQLEAEEMVTLDKRSDTGVRILRLRADRSRDRLVTTVEWMREAREGGTA
ncbi:protein DpdG [Lentzea sp.]|uniref:protein DpdG n=1 Tax=Lentzea sp. TaxID=56099 RepID=UPI002ED4D13A